MDAQTMPSNLALATACGDGPRARIEGGAKEEPQAPHSTGNATSPALPEGAEALLCTLPRCPSGCRCGSLNAQGS